LDFTLRSFGHPSDGAQDDSTVLRMASRITGALPEEGRYAVRGISEHKTEKAQHLG
jgi:hypothetical protein